jgi:hypothetical protein
LKFAGHGLGTFVDEPKGGRGVVVPGCPACRKRFNTSHQFVDHLANDVLPAAIRETRRDVTGRLILQAAYCGNE